MSDFDRLQNRAAFDDLISGLDLDAHVAPHELLIGRRLSFQYGLDAMEGEVLREGLHRECTTVLEDLDGYDVDEEEFEEYSDRATANMHRFLESMRDLSGLGPYVALRGPGIIYTPKAKGQNFEPIPLAGTETMFGIANAAACGDFRVVEDGDIEVLLEHPEELRKRPIAFGGLACIENVDVCISDGKVTRSFTEAYAPISNTQLRFFRAYPLENGD